MKNLKQSTELSARLRLRSEGETLLYSTFDVERNRVFFASSANVLYGIPLPPCHKEQQWSKDLFSSETEPVIFEPGDCITSLDYLMEKEALIVGTAFGYLVLHVVDCNITEVVGRVEGGIKTITSSPDGALLTVIAGLGQLLVMTHDWEVLYEVLLDPQLNDGIIDDLNDASDHQFESAVSWRGDGKYFATLSGLCEPLSLKMLKIWERDSGKLHASAESNALIGECLSWMPSGAKMVAAYDRRKEKKCPSIVLFEKNGLERSSFSIEEATETTIDILKWNCSSDLLAALVSCDGHDAIKIWYFSNNHWYLKQEIRYPKINKVKFDWDPIKPLRLICWTIDGDITVYNFIWVTAVTETSDAFVIDNSTILVSPLDVSLIPPPMHFFSLKFPSAVQEIAHICKNNKNKLAAFLSDGSLCTVELPAKDAWEQFEGKEFAIEVSQFDLIPRGVKHLTWLDSHILAGISSGESCCSTDNLSASSRTELNTCNDNMMGWFHGNSVLEIELVCSENCLPGLVASSGWQVKNFKKFSIEKPIVGLVSNPIKKSSAFIQLDGGSITEYTSSFSEPLGEIQLHKLGFESVFTTSCPWMKAILVRDGEKLKPLAFGLDDSGKLQVGQKILCNNCSSFSFYSDSDGVMQKVVTHLILTTKQDLLYIVSLDDILHGDPEIQLESFTSSSVRTRKGEDKDYINIWERGAKLMGVIHGDEAAVILQAVRGNLECIYPRKLVIVAIANALVQQRFREAMLMVRRHRIDFNIIVDYCGLQSFLNSVGEFVGQISNLGHITEFVCAIKNDNVMSTLYNSASSPPGRKKSVTMSGDHSDDFSSKSKISSVLEAVRTALEELVMASPPRELCILTTLANSEPPLLEEALGRIKVMRELELLGNDDDRRRSYPSAEEALKHLLWLSNTEAVYDAALGLYDLNLAAIVALNSDKDPKEFLPFLQELEHLQPPIMRYTIDLRLHRNESALKHIASAGSDHFEDCMKLMRSNPELFPLGLELFTDQVKCHQVLDAWGDHLNGEKCFEDAAIAYLACSSFEKALKAYRGCGDWKGMLTVAGLLKLTKEEVLQLATELCEELHALGKPAEAAKVALEYCADVTSGVAYYVMAREWQESLRISFLHERQDLVTEVKNSAVECANTLICEYEEGLEKVGKYLTRYLAVRQRRLSLAAKLQLEERPMDGLDDDNISEASSNFSGMSAYTRGSTRSSSISASPSTANKSREMRRQRKKGGKIRAGSPDEELALVEHLKGMSLSTSAQCELKSLLLALVMLGKEGTAQKLQRVAHNFQLTQIASVKLVEDALLSEKLDENAYSLDLYVNKTRESSDPEINTWQCKVLRSG